MSISSGQVIYGLSAQATPTGTNVSGSNLIGVSQTAQQMTTANVAYSLRCILFGDSDTMALNALTGSTSGSTSFVAGTAQVETATAAGTVSTAGNAKVVVTAAGMAGSPKTITFAVALSDTPTQWAVKCRAALNADAAFAAMFLADGATTAIRVTRLPTATLSTILPINTYAANDATLNIALDNDTCAGITTAASSADTTAGVLTSGAKIYDGDGKDFEGETLVASTAVLGMLIESLTNPLQISATPTGFCENVIAPGNKLLSFGTSGVYHPAVFAVYDGINPAEFRLTILGVTA